MKYLIRIILFLLFSSFTFAQYTSEHTGAHIDSMISKVEAIAISEVTSLQTTLDAKLVDADTTQFRTFSDLKYQALDTDLDNPDIPLDEVSDTLLLYQKVTDMSGYLQDADTTDFRTFSDLKYLDAADTSSLSNRIDLKFNTADVDDSLNTVRLLSFIEVYPDSGVSFTLLRSKVIIAIDSVFTLVQGTSASADFNLAYGTNRTSGTNVFAGDQTADNVTVGETFSSFSSATIPINNMLWIDLNDTANTPEEFICVIYYH